MAANHFRRVGAARPSHLMFTTGVGALVDLPNFSVLVRGLDDWNYSGIPDWEPIAEPRLLAAVRALLTDRSVKELRPAPWLDGVDREPNGPGRPRRRAGHAVPRLAALHGLRRAGPDRLERLRLRERPSPQATRGPVLPRQRAREEDRPQAARRRRPLRAGVHRRAPGRLPVRAFVHHGADCANG